MELREKVVVVTGGAHGIGAALCRRFGQEHPAAVVAADIDDSTGAFRTDVAREEDLARLVDHTLNRYGRIDVFCSNAGILIEGGEAAPQDDWDRIWRINVRAHITAAKLVLPGMLKRGSGCLLQTVSAAGLLTMIGSAPYSVTKHAALAFAEWLAVTYGKRGIYVAALCPLGVRTAMLGDGAKPASAWLTKGSVSAEEVAEVVVQGLRAGQFLILPHPQVREYFLNKATDYDRWLSEMRRVQEKVLGF